MRSKKPFLSLYEFRLKSIGDSQTTMVTRTSGEPSDDDEYFLDQTWATESTETSDDDEYCLSGTMLTESTEGSDDDEYCLDSTIQTDSIESSDPDELYVFDTGISTTMEHVTSCLPIKPRIN
jgi:hypothetical protein